MNEFECPRCGACNEVPNYMEQFSCRSCGSVVAISADAEQVDGIWRDLTRLNIVPTNP